MRVIIAAAGTAGHINPGIAIANEIKRKENDSEIIFIGTNRGLENDLVPRAGYELKTIDAYGLSKKPTIENIKKIFATLNSTKTARQIIKEFKPDIIVGAGGYICGPVVWAANKEKVPVVLHESNAYPGKAVKTLAKRVNAVLVGFEEAKERIPKAKKIIYTGTPVKIKKINYTKEEKSKKLEELGLDGNLPTFLVFGGSQGAQKINEALIDLVDKGICFDYQVIWATGQKQFDIVKNKLAETNIDINNTKNAKIVPYIYNMEEMMNIADVIISRSGAMTVTEIADLSKPSILVPLPGVSQNHQYYNAKALKDIGAASIVDNERINGDRLRREMERMIYNPELLEEMGKLAHTKSVENVEERIYNEIKNNIRS